MVFPVATNRRMKHVPWVNYALIGANVLVFLMTYREVALFGPALVQGYTLEQVMAYLPVIRFYLWPNQPQLYQFITYQFLHQDWMHLFFNMLFLWVFGNEVEERLGKVGYLAFYLAGGVLAGLAHALPADAGPILGASGAVAGVTGAYLALFPMTDITIILFFFGAFEVRSIALILFKIAQDAVFHFLGVGNVAYTAHLMGYGYGFVVCMALLLTRILPRNDQDLLSVIRHRWRHHAFKRLTRRGGYPWDLAKATDPIPADQAASLDPAQQALMERRAAILEALARADRPKAAQLYADLLKTDARQVLSQQAQLDVAHQLMSEGRYDTAATAYELMLARYPAYHDRDQVRLILGLIYARYLDEKDRARLLLKEALPGLGGENKALAQEVLDQVK